jgi:DNA polymerase-3 subunit gamma/tau
MSYQALARKWRPRCFADLVGQRHVVQVLNNAITKQRLHHAYLFTGTRGVGKTTIARIFAKCLNCEQGVTATPCGVCSICQEIDSGRFVDLLEIDAASRTKVEQTRELLENVPYAPAQGRYKVYLIDEVHMFSTSSFNALLKTLEEPPPHIKFLLATTDPQKLPITVLSRCLQFNLKRLLPEEISHQLQHILTQETISFESTALNLLAKAADGSMRDGLSLLDQAIAFGNGQVQTMDVRAMLGTLTHDLVINLVEALAAGNAAQVLETVALMTEQAPDFSQVLTELLNLLHQVAVGQIIPATLEHETELRIKQLALNLSPADIQLFYQIGILGQRDLQLATDARTGLEMVLLRMLAFRPATAATSNTQTYPTVSTPKTSNIPARPPLSPPPSVSLKPGSPIRLASHDDWRNFVSQLELTGVAKQLAINCEFISWDDNLLRLNLNANAANFRVPNAEERFLKTLQNYLGVHLKLDLRIANSNANVSIQQNTKIREQNDIYQEFTNDPLVQEVQNTFDAKVVPGTVRRIKSE